MTGAGQRSTNALWTAALLFALLSAAGVGGLDGVVAKWTATLPDGGTVWAKGTALLDSLALKQISNFLLGATLMLAAGLLLFLRSTRNVGFPLLYVGVVQFFSTLIADITKPQFGRLRPFEAVAGGDTWFVGENSFPSGHAAFYAGLFFPLIRLMPRATILWVLPPLFVSTARVMEHDHYLSDVSASLALACVLAAGLDFLAEKGDA